MFQSLGDRLQSVFDSLRGRGRLSEADVKAALRVARGALLVVVALIAYDRVVGAEPVAMVADSRSAQVFSHLQDRIEGQIPDDAPGWILARYEQLTAICVAPE